MELDLEAPWDLTEKGHHVTFLADVIIHDPAQRKHLVLSALHKKYLVLNGEIQPGAIAITVVNGHYDLGLHGPIISAGADTCILSHQVPLTPDLSEAVELCSGLGGIGDGLESLGVRIRVRSDIKQSFLDLLHRQGFEATVQGDVHDPSTMIAIHQQHPKSALVCSGFPCQPWSFLGDSLKSSDARATVLKAILRTSYLLRAHTILLECVVGARADRQIVQQLYAFCKATRFNAREVQLELADVWPSKRQRWWCLLSYPGSSPADLEPFPALSFVPKVGDVLPFMPQWDSDQQRQLELGLYEYRKFEECRGIKNNLVSSDQPLKTALHGWGNQLDPCPCGCRSGPMSLVRLHKKGLHGALVPMGSAMPEDSQLELHRHVHPWELSLLLGINPNKMWMPHLKLAMCALGQCASPLQSLWVLSQHWFHNCDLTSHAFCTPEEYLFRHMESLICARETMIPGTSVLTRPRDFMVNMRNALVSKAQARVIPRPVFEEENIDSSLMNDCQYDHAPTPSLPMSQQELLQREEHDMRTGDPLSTRLESFQFVPMSTIDPEKPTPINDSAPTKADWEMFDKTEEWDQKSTNLMRAQTQTHTAQCLSTCPSHTSCATAQDQKSTVPSCELQQVPAGLHPSHDIRSKHPSPVSRSVCQPTSGPEQVPTVFHSHDHAEVPIGHASVDPYLCHFDVTDHCLQDAESVSAACADQHRTENVEAENPCPSPRFHAMPLVPYDQPGPSPDINKDINIQSNGDNGMTCFTATSRKTDSSQVLPPHQPVNQSSSQLDEVPHARQQVHMEKLHCQTNSTVPAFMPETTAKTSNRQTATLPISRHAWPLRSREVETTNSTSCEGERNSDEAGCHAKTLSHATPMNQPEGTPMTIHCNTIQLPANVGMSQNLAASKESPASRARETREASAGDSFLGIWGTPFLRHPHVTPGAGLVVQPPEPCPEEGLQSTSQQLSRHGDKSCLPNGAVDIEHSAFLHASSARSAIPQPQSDKEDSMEAVHDPCPAHTRFQATPLVPYNQYGPTPIINMDNNLHQATDDAETCFIATTAPSKVPSAECQKERVTRTPLQEDTFYYHSIDNKAVQPDHVPAKNSVHSDAVDWAPKPSDAGISEISPCPAHPRFHAMPLDPYVQTGPSRDMNTNNHVHSTGSLRPTTVEQFQAGAVPGFASSKRHHAVSNHAAKMPKLMHSEHNDKCVEHSSVPIQPSSLQQSVGADGECPDSPSIEQLRASRPRVVVISLDGKPLMTSIAQDTTVSHLMQAEHALAHTNDILHCQDPMGNLLQPDDTLQDRQIICVVRQPVTDTCPQASAPCLSNDSRAALLWRQQAWVAIDEMQYYLHMLDCSFPGTIIGTAKVPQEIGGPEAVAQSLLHHVMTLFTTDQTKVVVLLHEAHWVPVVIRCISGQVQIWTPPGQNMLADFWLPQRDELPFPVMFCTSPFPHSFRADCGFQSLAWILSLLMNQQSTTPWTPDQACEWRLLFHKHLRNQGLDEEWIQTPLLLGGMKAANDPFQELLIAHGVRASRAAECATQLSRALGHQTVQRILASPKPWTDLKAAANLLHPPVRIVTAEELKAMVQARLADGKQVGSKNNKSKLPKHQATPILLRAEQLHLPHAVFKQDDGVEVGQLDVQHLHAHSSGVLLLNIHEARPYFTLQAPVSSEGVGLLVLEADDPSIPTCHARVKVPVQCKETQEPIIITAALLQVGTKHIRRNLPEKCLEIEETPNEVLRLVVYQDQYPGHWNEFITKPVKAIMEMEPFVSLDKGEVFEVWDRQFLSERLSKAAPDKAFCFMVNV